MFTSPRLRSTLVLAATILGVFAGSAWARQEKKPAQPSTTEKAAEPAQAMPELKVLDLGSKEDRRQIRFVARQGDVQTVAVKMKMDIASEIDGKKNPSPALPGIELTMQTTVTKVAQGTLAYKAEVVGTGLYATDGVDAQVAAFMDHGISQLGSLKGEIVATDRGFIKSGKFKLDDGDAMAESFINSMNQSWSQFSTPVPEEAVGVGAKWQVISPMNLNGLKSESVTTYTIKELTPTTAKLAAESVVTAKEQDVDLSATAPGAKMHVDKFSGKGTGEAELSLNGVMPVKCRMNSTADTSMNVIANGQTQSIKQTMKMEMAMDPGTKKTQEKEEKAEKK